MKKQIVTGLQTGIVFGIITGFLFLIGFTGTAATLIGKAWHDYAFRIISGLTADGFNIVNLVLFLSLMGIWAGGRGSRRSAEDANNLGKALSGAAAAGAPHGLIVAALAYGVGMLNLAHVQMTTYLAQLLPEVVQMFLLGKAPLEGAIWLFVLMLVSGIAGGLMAFYLGKQGWRKSIAARWQELRGQVEKRLNLQKAQKSRAFRPSSLFRLGGYPCRDHQEADRSWLVYSSNCWRPCGRPAKS